MVHVLLLPPFAILALWVLQYFPMQLLPHTSVFPNNSHSQLFVPLMLTLCIYTKKFFFKYRYFLLRSNPRWGAGVGRALCLVSPLLVGSCALVVQVCRPGVYMQNCLASACTKKVFCVHAKLPRECVYEKSVFRTCRIGVRVYVDVVCFSCKLFQNQPYIYYFVHFICKRKQIL